MKHLQLKYNLAHILFWELYCSLYGYIAVFLQYKGLSNSEIGIVTGLGAILSVPISPIISGLVDKFKTLTIRKLLLELLVVQIVSFIAITFINMPAVVIMILYILDITLALACVPLLSMICMNHLKIGNYINFGVSRGLGSIAYATTAFVLGVVIDAFNPTVLAYFFVIGCILFIIDIFTIPNAVIESNEAEDNNKGNIVDFIKKYKVFFIILLGFGFAFGASSMLATYLINIVKKLGGSTSLYGIAIFAMAASELPFMAITHTLLKKFKSEQLLFVAALAYIIRNSLIVFATNLPILIIGMIFQGISYGLFTATITYYVSDHLENKDEMMGQTMIGMLSTGFGSSIANVLGGLIQDTLGLTPMLLAAEAMTLVGVAIMALVLVKHIKTES